MAATLYVAVFDAATNDPSWSRADVGNGRNGWQASGYVASAVDTSPPTSTTNDDSPGITISGLTPGTSYKLWAIWDDGSQSSNKVGSAEFVATPTLTVVVASHAQAADALTLSISTSLSIDSTDHGQAAGAAPLTTTSTLLVGDASHSHAADSLTLSLAGTTNLTVDGASHAQFASSPALGVTTYATLSVSDASHAQFASSPALGVTTYATLSVSDASHAHAADTITLSISSGDVTLTISVATHQQLATSPVFGDLVTLIYKILANKQLLDPVTGELIIYDDDGSTVLFRADAWADAAGTARYSGGQLSRIDRLH